MDMDGVMDPTMQIFIKYIYIYKEVLIRIVGDVSISRGKMDRRGYICRGEIIESRV